ncbi:MAG: hypothetical protein ACYDBB_02240 [Armatimonadota bacterium]
MRIVFYLAGVLLFTTLVMAAEPINLTRTSLAEVSGSPVNGKADIDNPYHGVLNLFDNGMHMFNSFNYNHWLGDDAKPYNWVAVRFTVPVTVAKVQIQAPGCLEPICVEGYSSLLRHKDRKDNNSLLVLLYRNETVAAEVTIPLSGSHSTRSLGEEFGTALKEPLAGITRAELRVSQPYARIDEWRIMGMVPPGTTYTVGSPHITRTAGGSEEYARIDFKGWTVGLFKDAKPIVIETPTQFVITYRQGDLDLYRATIDRATGKVSGEALVELVPIPRKPPAGIN